MVRDVDQLLAFEVLVFQHGQLVRVEKALGPAHPDTLATVNNLANLLSDQGKLDEAEPLYRRALAGKEEALGPAHPSTLNSVGNLAILLNKKGDAAAAQELRAAYGV